MQPEELLAVDFRITDALGAEQRRSLGTATQLLDIPVHRQLSGESDLEFRNEVAARLVGIADAKRIALSLVGGESYDIQVLIVLIRSVFRSNDKGAFYLALALVAKVVGKAWEGLEVPGPESAKGRGVASSKYVRFIEGIFDQLYDALALWKESDDEVDYLQTESLVIDDGQVVDSWDELLALLDARLEQCGLRRARWEALRERIDSFLRVTELHAVEVSSEARPESGNSMDSEDELAASTTRAMSMRGSPGVRVESAPPSSAEYGPRSASLRVSAQYWELTERLRAFGWCLDQGDFEKAGLIAADLEKRLQNFDAAGIFPDLFAKYFEGTAAHAEQLEAGMVRPDSVRQISLTRLYETDLGRFLQLGHSDETDFIKFAEQA